MKVAFSLFLYIALLANLVVAKGRKTKVENVIVVSLEGSLDEMGIQYGTLLRQELHDVLDILLNYYVTTQQVPYSRLVEVAELFYQRYPYNYRQFLQGISQGSELPLDACKILNAMETLSSLTSSEIMNLSACAFLNIPACKSRTKYNIVGRNYDYSDVYGVIAKDYLNVIKLTTENSIDSFIIGMVGQIYCPSCVNKCGIFMELNNGMPSGGYYVEQGRQSLLINMLQVLQNSENFLQVDEQLSATESDFSLIVNVADANFVKSFEFSSSIGMKPFNPFLMEPFASTNYYQNTSWTGIPLPTDNTTWLGVTRLHNLLTLANKTDFFGINEFMTLMDTQLEDGGAKCELTIYQIIFDPSPENLTLYLKSTKNMQATWTSIPLLTFDSLFLEVKEDTSSHSNIRKQ